MSEQHPTGSQQEFLTLVEEELKKIYHAVIESISEFPDEEQDKINKLKRWQAFMDQFPSLASFRCSELLEEYEKRNGGDAVQSIQQQIMSIARKIVQEFERSLYPAVIIYLCTAGMQCAYI
jgi:hypothetical protein